MEYLSNYWSDISQILNLSLGDRTKIFNGRWPRNIKYRMLVRGKSEENLEEISSVALLSPACSNMFDNMAANTTRNNYSNLQWFNKEYSISFSNNCSLLLVKFFMVMLVFQKGLQRSSYQLFKADLMKIRAWYVGCGMWDVGCRL